MGRTRRLRRPWHCPDASWAAQLNGPAPWPLLLLQGILHGEDEKAAQAVVLEACKAGLPKLMVYALESLEYEARMDAAEVRCFARCTVRNVQCVHWSSALERGPL